VVGGRGARVPQIASTTRGRLSILRKTRYFTIEAPVLIDGLPFASDALVVSGPAPPPVFSVRSIRAICPAAGL